MKTIVIVDDESGIRLFLRDTLESLGAFNILEAQNGQEAIEILKSSSTAHLIITDINMPVMSGLQLCANLRRDPALAHIPIVLFSSAVSLADYAKAFRVSGFISKPPQKEKIVEIVRRVLSDAVSQCSN